MAISKKTREQVFNKCNGKCAYCGNPLEKGWHVDHFEAKRRINEWDSEKRKFIYTGNDYNEAKDHIGNYMPSCASCNINKHSMSLEEFRDLIQNFVNSLNKTSVQYKIAKRYGLLQETPKPVVFYFETIKS
jgi:5-methylcytosine-specific restriction endonuclease McrA